MFAQLRTGFMNAEKPAVTAHDLVRNIVINTLQVVGRNVSTEMQCFKGKIQPGQF